MRISDWSSDVCSSDLRRSPESLTAYDHYLLANEGRTLFTGESISRGLAAATKAITLEPTLGRAYVARAWLNYITVHCGGDFEKARTGMEADAQSALDVEMGEATWRDREGRDEKVMWVAGEVKKNNKR